MNIASECQSLIETQASVDSFQEATAWAKAVRAELARQQERINTLESLKVTANQVAESARRDAAARPVWKRLFKTGDEKRAAGDIARIVEEQTTCLSQQEALQRLREVTPTNQTERAAMLATVKRQLNEQMRDIKADAGRRVGQVSSSGQSYKGEAAEERARIREGRDRKVEALEQMRRKLDASFSRLESEAARLEAFY